jgi:hypothetical protein
MAGLLEQFRRDWNYAVTAVKALRRTYGDQQTLEAVEVEEE